MIDLNNYEERILLSKESLLNKIDPYDIFRYYISENFIIGKIFSSPLRTDKKPSFTIFYSSKNDELFWKDFRFGSGDVIIFVQKMFNLNYYEALSKIANDFNIEKLFIAVKNTIKSDKKPIIYENKDILKSRNVFEIKSKKFGKYDIWFWSQFGINKKCVKRYKITPISHFFINGSPIKASGLAYAYPEKKDGIVTYKIYQPLKVADKWFNNHDGSIIQGWRQLPRRGKDLIITSSLKDAMSIVCSTGIPSIAPQAESTTFKDSVIEELRKRFKNIYVLYDNDYTKSENWGQLCALKLVNKYEFIKNIKIPSEYESKDYSDLIKNRGIEVASGLLKTLIYEAKS